MDMSCVSASPAGSPSARTADLSLQIRNAAHLQFFSILPWRIYFGLSFGFTLLHFQPVPLKPLDLDTYIHTDDLFFQDNNLGV